MIRVLVQAIVFLLIALSQNAQAESECSKIMSRRGPAPWT